MKYTMVIRTPVGETFHRKGKPSELVTWARRKLNSYERETIDWTAAMDMTILEYYKTLGPSEIARRLGPPITKNAVIGRRRTLAKKLPHVGEGRTMPERLGGK